MEGCIGKQIAAKTSPLFVQGHKKYIFRIQRITILKKCKYEARFFQGEVIRNAQFQLSRIGYFAVFLQIYKSPQLPHLL